MKQQIDNRLSERKIRAAQEKKVSVQNLQMEMYCCVSYSKVWANILEISNRKCEYIIAMEVQCQRKLKGDIGLG